MRKVIVFMNLTLDGVMQAPGRPEEDQRGGFTRGGWAAPYDAMQSSEAGEHMAHFGTLLMGRRTYEDFYAFWTKQTNNPYTGMLNNMQKYVASTTLNEPLAWQNSTLLKGDAAQTVKALKAEKGEDIVIMGSGKLIESLMKAHLIDRYLLMIHPLVLGTGHRLFADGVESTLTLISAKATPKGVVVGVYEPETK